MTHQAGNARPRILLVAPAMSIMGGQAVQASRLLHALAKETSLTIDFQCIGPDVGFLRRFKYVRTLASLLLYLFHMLRRVWRYDILHVFTASYYSYLLWSVPALAVAKLYGKKIVLNYRDGQAEDHLRHWKSAIPTIRHMDAIVAPSDFLVDVFAKFGLRIHSISNILDRETFRYRRRSRLRPLFLHNRMLDSLYNVACTLRAFGQVQQVYPEAALTLAHDGPLRAELEDYARQLGLRNTTFIGKVPHHKIAQLYDSADIYFTSPNIDNMPGSILECFASGLPVVATKAGGIPYIATHDVTALLVECDDDQAMTQSALRLLRDPELVERLTGAAYDYCAQYGEDAVRRQWTAFYYRMLSPGEQASLRP